MITYTLIRSHRRTVAIHITKAAAVEVRAPLKMAKSDIDSLIAEKENWINSHLVCRERLNKEKNTFTLNYDDAIIFCGKLYPIRCKDGTRAGFDGECFYLPPNLPPGGVKSAVVQIYKETIKRIVKDKVDEYASQMNLTPKAVKITNAKTRWGSCSGKNSINFSWRLVMADEDVIDYVIVHELSHIKEHNHSRRFWAVVRSVLPDYKERQKKLKQLQEKLASQDWE
jgi:predicted metal-dependent hydrolase